MNPPLAQLAEALALRANKCGFESLKGDHPIYCPPVWKVYGPYKRKDGRKHVIVYDGSRRLTISYPRFIVECLLERELDVNEEVHHKNNNKCDDRIENLEIKNSTLHRQGHRAIPESFECQCGTHFTLDGIELSRMKSERSRHPNIKGPYCSRECAGKYA